MTLEEFWEIRFDEDNVLEHYDGVKALFSKPLEEEIPENYDTVYPLLDIKGSLKNLNEYVRIEEFIQILKAHHPVAYKSVFYYYRASLTEHYLYENNREGLERCVEDFVEMPIEGYDKMLRALRQMQVYGHIDLVDELICGIYDTVVVSDELSQGAAFDLALIKSHIELEKVYANYKKTGTFDWDEYNKTIPKFGFETEGTFLKLCETGLSGSPDAIEERIRAGFDENKDICVEILEKAFMKYMLDEKEMPFALSAYIWNYLYKYWEEKEIYDEEVFYDIETYFNYHAEAYRNFLRKYSGFVMDYRFSAVALLWGICYVYDFLKALNFITNTEYEDVQKAVNEYKYDLIYENLSLLSQYSFVNDWKKSDMETSEDKQKISAIFDEYRDAPNKKIQADQRGHFFSSAPTHSSRLAPSANTVYRPIIAKPKIGRNEKVTVEYKDGTIKKDVKYKKVKTDVEMEKCKII